MYYYYYCFITPTTHVKCDLCILQGVEVAARAASRPRNERHRGSLLSTGGMGTSAGAPCPPPFDGGGGGMGGAWRGGRTRYLLLLLLLLLLASKVDTEKNKFCKY